KNAVLDDWCAKEKRDPTAIIRTVNVGFYMAADDKGVPRAEAEYTSHWGENAERKGFLRGAPKRAIEMVEGYRAAGVARLNIALRQGPYDWDALHAFAEQVMPAFGATRPR
ncbi:MAG: LLM class flavin-dependent oxidoreductase, partial [bacterium]